LHEWVVPDWPAPKGVRALITTRGGGVSVGEHGSLNLATHVGDDIAAVAENRARLRRHVPAEPVWLNQVHGIAVVAADGAAPGATGDAAVARCAATVCVVMTADCLPVLLCDQSGSVVGVAHAGWRGLAAGVIEATVGTMGAAAGEILAYLGPAIGPASFEVGAEVRAAFAAYDPKAVRAFQAKAHGKWLADLYVLARLRLADAGVTQVFGGEFDTYAQPLRFFSYRRSQRSGRMASLIWLEP
jgi:YfiH family protein